MSNAKIVHYSLINIDKENADINVIIGERSNGKSYQLKHLKAIEKYLETGKRFILLRRWKEEISPAKVEQYFKDVDIYKLTGGKYNCIVTYTKRIYLGNFDAEKFKTTRGEQIGYVVALSTEQSYAGASYLDVNDIIFEEFISRDSYLANEPDKLMNFYCTVDRKRKTTKIWMAGNTISRVCPYFNEWGLYDILKNQKQGTIITTLKESTEDDKVKIAIEYCADTGASSHTIGKHKNMLNRGDWQSDPQPHLPKSYKEYEKLFQIIFQYQAFKFIGEYIMDKKTKETCWFIYPYKGKINNKTLVFSDTIKVSKYWQRDIYNISLKNEKLQNLLNTFKENNIFYASDICGTEFKSLIDFTIRK